MQPHGQAGPYDDTIDADGVARGLQYLVDLLLEREHISHDGGKLEQPLRARR